MKYIVPQFQSVGLASKLIQTKIWGGMDVFSNSFRTLTLLSALETD